MGRVTLKGKSEAQILAIDSIDINVLNELLHRKTLEKLKLDSELLILDRARRLKQQRIKQLRKRV